MTTRTALTCAVLLVLGGACNGQFRFDELSADGGPDGSADGLDGASTDGVAGACSRDDDCARFGLRCDLVSGTCVACADDTHCSGALPRCDSALHRCVECGSSADCGERARCEPRTRRCLATCSAIDPTCPVGFECDEDDTRCRRCEHDDFCEEKEPRTPHCDPQLFVCVECTSDAQCGSSTPACDRTRGRCVECFRGDQCPPERPVCGASGTCLAP